MVSSILKVHFLGHPVFLLVSPLKFLVWNWSHPIKKNDWFGCKSSQYGTGPSTTEMTIGIFSISSHWILIFTWMMN